MVNWKGASGSDIIGYAEGNKQMSDYPALYEAERKIRIGYAESLAIKDTEIKELKRKIRSVLPSLLDTVKDHANQNGHPADGTGYYGSSIRLAKELLDLV